MKRKVVASVLAVVVAISLVFVGCAPAPTPTPTPTPTPEPKYTWKIGDVGIPPEHTGTLTEVKFAELLKERTNGQIELTLHGAAIGGMYDQFENVVRGTQEIGLLMPSPHFDKRLQVVYMPYIVSTWDEGEEVYNPGGWMAQLLKPIYAEVGIELLGFAYVGMDGYGNTKGPVIKPSDIADLGIKTRVWCTADRLLFKPLGPTVSMPFSDLYTALQTGLCDAQDNAPSNTYMALRDVTEYYTTINWMFEVITLMMNKELYDSLTPELQAVIHKCAIEALAEYNPVAKGEDETYLQKMEEYGIQVTRLSSEQLVPWVEHGRSVWTDMREECGTDIVKYVTAHAK